MSLSLPHGRMGRIALTVGVAVAVLAGTAAAVALPGRDELPENAVFEYRGEVVTKTQLNERVDVLAALYGVTKPTEAKKKRSFDRDAAKSMAVSLILRRAAKERGIVISDKQANDQLDRLVEDQLAGGQEQFTEFLSSSGLSERDVLSEVKDQIATSRLAESITAEVEPAAEADIKKAYDDHRRDMVTPEVRHLRNIVVSSKADADRVLSQAKSGVDFAELANTWSVDGSTRSKGGDLGSVSAAQLDDAYAEAAFKAPVRGLFGPVKTQHGWNVGQVVAVTKPEPVPYAAIHDDLSSALLDKAKLQKWNAYLKEVLEDAEVRYADAYRPADPTSLPSGVPTPSEGTRSE